MNVVCLALLPPVHDGAGTQTTRNNWGQSEVKQSRWNFDAGQIMFKHEIESSLDMVQALDGCG